jgi:phage RecT family recombinase
MTATEDNMTQTGNLPAKVNASKAVDSLVAMCEERFSPVMGEHSSVDWATFALGVRAACLKNPQLVGAIQQNPAPLIQALSQAAAIGLSPHPDLHHFYLVPFKGQIQALVGYRGLVHLAMQSGMVEDVQAFVLYRDEMESLRETRAPLIDPASGEPNIIPDNRLIDGVTRTDDDIVGAMAIARIKGRSRPITHTMTKDQIEKRRLAGQGNTPAWKNWYAEQAQKTAIRGLLRSGRVPLGRQADAIKRAMSDEVMIPATARVVREDSKQIAHRPDEFERRNADPFPSPEQVTNELLEDVWAAADRAGLDAESVEALVGSRFHGRALEDLETEELRALIGMVA